jgi:hypothetical protein
MVTVPVKVGDAMLALVASVGTAVALVKSIADGVPRSGVTKVGDVANTFAPVPVSSVNADARFALLGVAKKVATPAPRPETPVDIGRPVALVNVPDAGVPKAGVIKAGLVANTKEPVPVSSEMTPASSVEVVAAN